jgi:hypothetical protein
LSLQIIQSLAHSSNGVSHSSIDTSLANAAENKMRQALRRHRMN